MIWSRTHWVDLHPLWGWFLRKATFSFIILTIIELSNGTIGIPSNFLLLAVCSVNFCSLRQPPQPRATPGSSIRVCRIRIWSSNGIPSHDKVGLTVWSQTFCHFHLSRIFIFCEKIEFKEHTPCAIGAPAKGKTKQKKYVISKRVLAQIENLFRLISLVSALWALCVLTERPAKWVLPALSTWQRR